MGAAIGDALRPGEDLAYGYVGAEELVVRYQSQGNIARPWASVSKLVTALAVHVAIEEASLQRWEPLGDYQLIVEDLLAHASGLPTGEVADVSMSTPWQVRPICAPHERRMYSNLGYELLGYGIAQHCTMPFNHYAREAVLEPAGMTQASYPPGLLATGPVTGAAFGLVGTIADLVSLVRVLCYPSLVTSETLMALRTPFAPELVGVLPGFGRQDPNSWGLGPEVRGTKSPHWMGSAVSEQSYGHFGQSGSFLWIDPTQRFFAVFLGAKPFGGWAKNRWPVLNNAIVEELASS
ncbi:serine hydrolase [Ferrimicrobium sp.]|uniref:serine hydrolase domain-containing protein n=1 Tax=Ferrimicrobium sp. TaxID=2926050 RepID=UPI0026309AE0|nr:serine hydrolase domain-containing protein [Ferrimicrobium sp.]